MSATSPQPRNGKDDVIIHVFVVGFHHKKGCVVEFAYPPLSTGDDMNCGELPEPWKHLPSLALPDGAHNYEEDAIYFHLPSLENPAQTIYGISCYRQMNAQQLIRKSSDITRGSVQKSVCVLSRLPLFGLIQAKLELITHAYFDERDFSKVSLLEETYRNLNSSLPKDLCDSQQVFLGGTACHVCQSQQMSSARSGFQRVSGLISDANSQHMHGFRSLLKVLFYKSPVKDLCAVILTLCSLVPGMVETGLSEAVSFSSSTSSGHLSGSYELLDGDLSKEISKENNNLVCSDSSVVENACKDSSGGEDHENISSNELSVEGILNNVVPPPENTNENFNLVVVEQVQQNSEPLNSSTPNKLFSAGENRLSQSSSDTENDSWIKVNQLVPESGSSTTSVTSTDAEMKADCALTNEENRLLNEINMILQVDDSKSLPLDAVPNVQNDSVSLCDFRVKITGESGSSSNLTRDSSATSLPLIGKSSFFDIFEDEATSKNGSLPDMQDGQKLDVALNDLPNVADLDCEECGFPLAVFTKGMLCHPYLSLPFLDILSDMSIRGFLVGATNILFKQKKHLFDVIVEIDEGKIEILDSELRRQLSLTTEDLRFADHLLRNVMEDKKDVFLDGTGWEGGDEWLRAQFKLYLVGALRTSLEDAPSSREADAFNSSFMNSWKLTHNYRMWNRSVHTKVTKLLPGVSPLMLFSFFSHPFHGQLSMADMKLRLSHSMQSSEKGRRINSAVASTGKVVLQTGKAVGGAISSAKSVVSSWWSNLGAADKKEEKGLDSLQSEPMIHGLRFSKSEESPKLEGKSGH